IEERGHRSVDLIIANELASHHDRPARSIGVRTPQLKCRAELITHDSPDTKRLDVLTDVLPQDNARAKVVLLLENHVAIWKAERHTPGGKHLAVDRTRLNDPF